MLDFVRSLNLEEKLSPVKNKEIVWFYVFLPSLICYFMILTNYINSKPIIGSIENYDSSFTNLVYPSKNIEIIANNLVNTDGLLWVQDDAASLSYLMFSDTVLNRIYKWEEGKGMFTVGKTIYVENSGCKSNLTYCSSLNEPGSNGLLRKDSLSLDLLTCQHGERAISLLRENGTRSFIATHFNHSLLNSPNDMIRSPDGHLYFTDPTDGLVDKQSLGIYNQEQSHSGVYMIRSEYLSISIQTGIPTEQVWLMDSTLDSPDGLAFSPDFSKLYVSNANHLNPIWKVYDVTDTGILKNGRVFYNASKLYSEECQNNNKHQEIYCSNIHIGSPKGMKVDIHGNLFATGPGGVLVISPDSKLIGRFRFNQTVSNIAFGADGRLYFSIKDIIARIWIKTKPNRLVFSK